MWRYQAGMVFVLAAMVLAAPANAASPTDFCTAAQTLAKAAPDQARAALTRAILSGDPCPDGLKALAPEAPPGAGTMKRIEGWIAAWSKVIGVVAGAVLVGVLLLAALFSLATQSRRARRSLRVIPLVRRLMQPSVKVADFTGGANGEGATVSAMTGLALRRLHIESEGLEVFTGAESFGASVAKLGDVAPQFKALGAILSFVTDTAAWPRYQLGGTLEADAGEGIGLALALDRKDRAADGTLLVHALARRGPKAKAFTQQMLGMLAAGWTEWAVRHDELPNTFEYDVKPRSYAYLRAAAVYEYFGYPDRAEDAYVQALHEDETNVAALANLGRIRGRSDFAGGVMLLKSAVLALEPQP